MKRYLLMILTALILYPAVIQAKNRDYTGKPSNNPLLTARPAKEYQVHNVGNIWSATSNFGNYGEPNAKMPSGEWPSGSEVYYIWEGRFWMGVNVGGEKLCSHADYGNYELEPTEGSTFGFGPTAPVPIKSTQDSYVTFDDLKETGGHTPVGLKVIQRGLAWSVPDFDEFIGYEYYIINVSGQTLNGFFASWIFDNDVAAGPGGDADQANIDDLVDYDGCTYGEDSNPYMYDIVENYDIDESGDLEGYDEWGWPYGRADTRPSDGADLNPNFEPDSIHPDGIWDEYQVYVDPNGPIIYRHDEPDSGYGLIVGAAGDTIREPLHGWVIPRDMSYMYDGDYPSSSENDVGERSLGGTNAGFVGGRILWTDMTYSGETMPRPYSHQWWNWESDPGSDEEKYNYMGGNHPASLNFKFLPHPFDYLAGAPAFDYRYMTSSGPFDGWAADDTLRFVYVYAIGMGLEGLRQSMDNSMVAYYSGSEISNPANPSAFDADKHWILPVPPAIPSLNYSPGDREVVLRWSDEAEYTIDVLLGTTDFEGYKIYRSKYNASAWELIYACDQGVGATLTYTTDGTCVNPKILASGDTLYYGEPGHADSAGVVTVRKDLPDLVHTFTDTGGVINAWESQIEKPINGLPYYYAVVSYDPDKMATHAMPSIESAKSNYMKDPATGAPMAIIPRATTESTLSKVKVVPNPYKGTSLFEARYEDKVEFTHLPAQCKISVFTLTGDLVREIYHNDVNSGVEDWDLISRNNQAVVSGLYIYIVETDNDKNVGKLLIIR